MKRNCHHYSITRKKKFILIYRRRKSLLKKYGVIYNAWSMWVRYGCVVVAWRLRLVRGSAMCSASLRPTAFQVERPTWSTEITHALPKSGSMTGNTFTTLLTQVRSQNRTFDLVGFKKKLWNPLGVFFYIYFFFYFLSHPHVLKFTLRHPTCTSFDF